MGQKALLYGTVLIGTYLLVYYYTGAGRVIGAAGDGSVGVIKAFQGR